MLQPSYPSYDSIAESVRTPEMLASEQWQSYCRARDNGHTKFVTDARKFEDFYYGKQWDENVEKELDTERRPHHSVNLVLSTVNAVVGEYVGQRQEIVFKPRGRGAVDSTAEALTKMAMHISDDSHSRWVEKSVFMDGIIADRGYFDIRLDACENITGEIRETSLDPIDVLLDPGARDYDPKTWSEVTLTRWMTPDQIGVMYGAEKGDKLRYVTDYDTWGADALAIGPETFSQDRNYYTSGPQHMSGGSYGFGDDWKRVKRVRILERQYYKLDMRKYFVDPRTGDKSPVPDSWPKDKVELVTKVYGLIVMPQMERRIRWTVTACNEVLKDGWSPYRRFTVIPYFPYFRRGRPFGVVRNLIDPQELLNKSSSQTLHVVNTTANSGWMIQAGSLVNMTVDELRKVGAKTGLVLEFQRGFEKPEKIVPNQIPTGLLQITNSAVAYFRDISGVSDAMLGSPGREISGDALAIKERRGLAQLDTVFDNLAFTRQLRAEMILEMIQDFYTESRVLKIVITDDDGNEKNEDVLMNYQQTTGEILNDVTVGEYRVVVSSRTARDSMDDAAFAQMISMREQGIMVPDWAIMEASSVDRKREIAQWMRQQQGAAAPTEEDIKRAQMQEELTLRRQMAEISEIEAKAQERLANAAMLQAKAESIGGELQAEIVKLGAQLRADAEAQLVELQKTRDELQTRIVIAQGKGTTEQNTAMLSALTKRLETESRERVETMKAQAQITAARGYGTSFNGGKK